MTLPDLNLLATLNVLLDEGSVAGAARRLGLSASAASRALARLREVTGDPLLVRAGRALVPTPRALELRTQVARLVEEGNAVLRPVAPVDPAQLRRTFTLRVTEGFVEGFGAALVQRVAREAPGVRLCFLPKTSKDPGPLRDGSVDLDTGVIGAATGQDLRARPLMRDRFVGVVRAGHALCEGEPDAACYAACDHVVVSRGGRTRTGIDDTLAGLGLERRVATVVGSFGAALALARATDLVATVPARYTAGMQDGMLVFALPFAPHEIVVSMMWHPRMDADPGHRWLRACVHAVCGDPDSL